MLWMQKDLESVGCRWTLNSNLQQKGSSDKQILLCLLDGDGINNNNWKNKSFIQQKLLTVQQTEAANKQIKHQIYKQLK